jgi:DNA-binding HxlR family transcriptional regulator
MRWVGAMCSIAPPWGYRTHRGIDKTWVHIILVKILKGRNHIGDLNTSGRITLRWISKQ